MPSQRLRSCPVLPNGRHQRDCSWPRARVDGERIWLMPRIVRAGGLGRIDQTAELGALRAQALDRSRQEAAAPQRAGDRARQQARAHRLGRSQQGAQLRMREDACGFVPTCLSVAPCSEPSRPSPAGGRKERPALTAPARGVPRMCRPGRRNGLMARTKELHR
jgi:hypothetical protein